MGEALTPTDETEVVRLDAAARALCHRLASSENDYDADLLDGVRYKAKCSKINAELEAIEHERIKLLIART